MNPFKFVVRRPFATLMMVAAVLAAGVFGLKKMRAESYPQGTPKVYVCLDYCEEKYHASKEFVVSKYEAYFHSGHAEAHPVEQHKIFVTSPKKEDVILTQQYVCQIRSQKHIEIRALEGGYLKEIMVREGQAIKQGAPMFKIVPVLYQAKLDAENAKAKHAQLELQYTQKLASGATPAVSQSEVLLLQAKYAEAVAQAKSAQAELDFTDIKAPFGGLVDRLEQREGSLIKEEGILTTLSDNSVMWVYFNVPEARYLEYMTSSQEDKDSEKIELMLANGNKFEQIGKIGAIESKFNPETGNIAFRADFPNPDGLLRHGQTGNILVHRLARNAMVIPQRATFENLAKRYVFVVDKDEVVHQREIVIQNELDDIFVIKKGVAETDRIVLEGIRQIHEGEKVEGEYRKPEEVFATAKNRAE